MHAGHVVMEHGYSFSMVQENYLDSRSDLHKAFAVSDKKVRGSGSSFVRETSSNGETQEFDKLKLKKDEKKFYKATGYHPQNPMRLCEWLSLADTQVLRFWDRRSQTTHSQCSSGSDCVYAARRMITPKVRRSSPSSASSCRASS